MAFFTRKGLSVPELPAGLSVTVEELIDETTTAADSVPENDLTPVGSIIASTSSSITNVNASNIPPSPPPPPHPSLPSSLPPSHDTNNDDTSKDRFDYVIDRTYGVEV